MCHWTFDAVRSAELIDLPLVALHPRPLDASATPTRCGDREDVDRWVTESYGRRL